MIGEATQQLVIMTIDDDPHHVAPMMQIKRDLTCNPRPNSLKSIVNANRWFKMLDKRSQSVNSTTLLTFKLDIVSFIAA